QLAHMSRLLDDLLDVGRLSRGKLTLEPGKVDFGVVVREVVGDHRAGFESRGLTFEACLPDAPVWLEGDAVRLAQVVDNLVTNALKYTPPPGRVDVSVRRGDGEVRLEVRDTGVGVDPSLTARIFEPFEQAPQSIARSSGGLGLGLALAQRVAELHGGALSVESEGVGRGSVFILTLPVAPGEAATPPSPSPAPTPTDAGPWRFLVVEDNEDAAELVVMLLRRRGHSVQHVALGADAVEAVRDGEFDVVLCDIGLPGMDGYEVARAVRALPGGDRLRIVALSGYGQADDRRKSREAGFDAHLLKPASLDAVLAAVAARG
ncbi:MAG: ATP-binding protein, partial [Sandaracinaceae bacterium]